jgi:murein DD-endopeptidase MepM/ murein hydrolase activator NlpD
LQAQIAIATQELEAAMARLEEQELQLAGRAAALYIHSTDTYTTVLLGHHDFHDFMAATEYESRVLGADVTVLHDVEIAKADVEIRRQLVEWKRDAVRKQQDEITRNAKRIDALRQEQGAARHAVLSEIDYRAQLLARVRDEKSAYVEALNNMLAESASIEALLNGAQSGQKVFAGGGHGYLVWPTTGRITSPYGWRTHPIYGYRSFHTGIDIGAPQGNRVIAARRGEILYTGYKGAYGLIVIVDHGNQVATVYAHLSKVFVHTGQFVSAKQLIAAVGSTGWSTGPHLHFEVRINGEHTNPIKYL